MSAPATDRPGWVQRRIDRLSARLTEPLAQADAEDLAGGVRGTGCPMLATCRPGSRVSVTGRIRWVTVGGGDDFLGLTAEVFDGTEAVQVCWLGRHAIAGIDTGRHLTVDGRLGRRDGHLVMFNPRYTLLEAAPSAV